VTWNVANKNGFDGFFTDKLDSAADTDFTGSYIANNTANSNGGAGFDSFRTYISQWAHNTGNSNGEEGFYLDVPASDTVNGNSGRHNGDSGFVFNDTIPAFCQSAVRGPFGNCDATEIQFNTGVGNGDFGFWADSLQSSTMNAANNNGTSPTDCVNVNCVAHLASIHPSSIFLTYAHTKTEQAAPAHIAAPAPPPHH